MGSVQARYLIIGDKWPMSDLALEAFEAFAQFVIAVDNEKWSNKFQLEYSRTDLKKLTRLKLN